MDKDGLRGDLSMKRAISMDKDWFRGDLSMKSTNFMDNEGFLKCAPFIGQFNN